MNGLQNVKDNRMVLVGSSGSGSPVWWLVCKWELTELWLGGRVLILLILFSVIVSVTSVMQQAESQLSLIPPPEIVFITLQSIITFGLFIGLIVGADSISGERERTTLESLLLTPTSRRQIVVGKFLAALSPWPVAFIVSIPYMVMLAQGDEVLGPALFLGALMGSVLAIAFTGFGMLVSVWSNSNKISLFVSLLVYVLFLIPTLWPGAAQKGDLGYLIQQLNPMQGTNEFLEKVLVNNRTVQEKFPYIVAAILSAVVVLGLLFLYAAPRLRLEGGTPRLIPRQRRVRVTGLSVIVIACLIASLSTALPLQAGAPMGAELPQVQEEKLLIGQSSEPEQAFQISVDLDHKTVKTGDTIEFSTVVTNNSTEVSPPFHVSMNIIKIGSGDPVDPEDWSPERSQEGDPLAPGEFAEQSWEVDAILEGNYMVYMTVIPTPTGPDTTSQTISSRGIHLTVKPFVRTNPGGVLPIAIGIPVALALGTLLVRRRGHRTSATAGSQSVDQT